MLAFCCGSPTLRTSDIELCLKLDSCALVLTYMGIPSVLRVKFTSQRFLNQISRLPVPHGIQNSAVGYSKIYSNITMLAFCCGDPTLRTSHIEPQLNIDSTTLWCWGTWGFQMCFELSSHLKDFWIKSKDYPFHIGLKIWRAVFIYIYVLAFCCGDPTLRTSRIELRLNIDSTTLLCWCTWGFQMCFGG